MSDRIKIAEAMGAKCVDGVWHWKGSTWDSLIFDPFTDANDDYAVLEWMRKRNKLQCLRSRYWNRSCDYRVGDYARAALKALAQQ